MVEDYQQTEIWDPDRWAKRYGRILHPEIYRAKVQPKIDRIRTAGGANEARLAQFEARITKLLDQLGVSRELMPFYHAYALETWARAREKEWTVDRVNEWRMIRMKWESRGLEAGILDRLDRMIPLGRGKEG